MKRCEPQRPGIVVAGCGPGRLRAGTACCTLHPPGRARRAIRVGLPA